jgi:hypothetical protein
LKICHEFTRFLSLENGPLSLSVALFDSDGAIREQNRLRVELSLSR